MRWRVYLRNLLRRYTPAVAAGIVVDQFRLGHQAAAVLNAAIAFDSYRSIVRTMPGRQFPGTGGYRKRQRTEYSGDPSNYQQISYAAAKDGGNKKVSINTLVRANIYRQDFWFKGIKSFDTNGNYWMDKGQPSLRQLPCYIFAPFHAHQQFNGVNFVPSPFRRLFQNVTTGSFRTSAMNGQLIGGGASTLLQSVDNSTNAPSSMGPQGLLKWTEFKFNLWGAKNKSTRWTIAWVRSKTGDTCPFRYQSTVEVDERLNNEIMEYIRPKVVNPIATSNDMAPTDWQVLKSYVYDIDPIDLQEGDNDPHVKRVTIFNRWNRMLKFGYTTATTTSIVDQVTELSEPSNNMSENIQGVLNVRPEDDKDVWLMITATNYTPFAPDNVPSNTVDPSFDMSFRSSWSKLGL